ncbi:tRNA-specific adenosine deaminase 3, partial [Enteropsectra breve]
VEVPAFSPCTSKQYNDACAYWPCHYTYRIYETPDFALAHEMAIKLNDKPCTDDICCSCVCLIADKGEVLSVKQDYEAILGHAVLDAVSEISKSKRGYLCTGYSAYLLNEPCVGCAMALVHGRIKNVFVLHMKSNGPFSEMKLNSNRKLNHRYNVYRALN